MILGLPYSKARVITVKFHITLLAIFLSFEKGIATRKKICLRKYHYGNNK